LELKPDNPDVLSDLGVMYRRSGNPKKAISAFDEVQRIDPSHTMSLFNKGIVQFYDLDLKNEALETWKKLASIDPGFKMPTGELITDFIGSIKLINN
jgi:tetratricopeptide (TPR) repeat protein